MTDDRYQLLRLLEAILFASTEPLSEDQLASRMPEGSDINGLLQELKDHYANRGVHLQAFEDRLHFVVDHADINAAQDVDKGDNDARDRVATDEL